MEEEGRWEGQNFQQLKKVQRLEEEEETLHYWYFIFPENVLLNSIHSSRKTKFNTHLCQDITHANFKIAGYNITITGYWVFTQGIVWRSDSCCDTVYMCSHILVPPATHPKTQNNTYSTTLVANWHTIPRCSVRLICTTHSHIMLGEYLQYHTIPWCSVRWIPATVLSSYSKRGNCHTVPRHSVMWLSATQ